MTSTRAVLQACVGRTGPVSIKRDVLGVFGVNPFTTQATRRSLRNRLMLMQTTPFVRVAAVHIATEFESQPFDLQRGFDEANDELLRMCGLWILVTANVLVRTDRFGRQGRVEIEDCKTGSDHDVSDDEDALFDLGRDRGARVVVYYLPSATPPYAGCGSHPPGRRGFWIKTFVSENISMPGRLFAHEFCHVIGNLSHVDYPDNLMRETVLGGSLTVYQCRAIMADPDVERCGIGAP